MAAEELERILCCLLQPDNAVIQQATIQLKETLKQPAALSHLCHVMTSCQNPQIRQFAAVLVRRRMTRHWWKLSAPEQDTLKNLILSTLAQETDHKACLGLAQLAAVILTHESLERWPQLLQVIQQGAQSDNPTQCEVGLLLLSCALEQDPDVFAPHFTELLQLFNRILSNLSHPGPLYYALRTLSNMIPGLSLDEMVLLTSMMPKVISAIQELIRVNEAHACDAMDVFDQLLDAEVSILVDNLSDVVGFCLEVGANPDVGDSLRVKALFCITCLGKLRSKAILRKKLLPTVINALFPIICAEPPPGQMDAEDELTEEVIEDQPEVQSPKHYAVQVIDVLALHLPAEKMFAQLTPLMEPALLSPNPYHRKAGLMCLAVLSEGCGDHIRKKHLQPLLQVVCRALSDESQVVRNAALFTLGQFSENLQPDITKYCDDIMPLLLRYLDGVELAHTSHLAKAYYALEIFIENLGKKISPYLHSLMERMLSILSSPVSPRTKELVVSALGAIARAAKGDFVPYFQAVMDILIGYLLTNREDLRSVQIQSLETLAVIASTIGNDVFLPVANKCCQLGLDLCDQVDDPDLRRCAFSLFSSLCIVMENGIAPYLPRITTLLLCSLKSTEGIETHYSTDYSFLLFDDEEEEAEVEGDETLSDDDDESDDFLELSRPCVRNSFLDEKEDACLTLGELAYHASEAFLPYMDSCFPEIIKMLEHFFAGVRKTSYISMGLFTVGLNRVCERDPSEANTAALQKMLSVVMPVLLEGLREERETQVVVEILETVVKVVVNCKQEAFRDRGRLGELCRAIRLALEKKLACQEDCLDEDDETEEDAEHDSMLIEYAGEVIPALARAVGGETFAPYFAGFLPLLLNRLKPSCCEAEKSFAVGILAETIQGLGRTSRTFVARLLPSFIKAVRDRDLEVRSNAIFGLGVMAEHGGEIMHEHYPKLLSILSTIISQEKNNRATDNVCGAVARMIMANPGAVPVGQVLSAMLRALPLADDWEEYNTVFRCFTVTYERDPQQILRLMQEIVQASSSILGAHTVPIAAHNVLVPFLRNLCLHHPEKFQSAKLSLPPEAQALLETVLAASCGGGGEVVPLPQAP